MNDQDKSDKYDEIYNDLKEQLNINDTYNAYTEDLLKDYISLAKTKDELIKDIEERGVTVEYNNGGGQTGYKKNDSVSEVPKINKQMTLLLAFLGISPSKKVKEDGDSDSDI